MEGLPQLRPHTVRVSILVFVELALDDQPPSRVRTTISSVSILVFVELALDE